MAGPKSKMRQVLKDYLSVFSTRVLFWFRGHTKSAKKLVKIFGLGPAIC